MSALAALCVGLAVLAATWPVRVPRTAASDRQVHTDDQLEHRSGAFAGMSPLQTTGSGPAVPAPSPVVPVVVGRSVVPVVPVVAVAEVAELLGLVLRTGTSLIDALEAVTPLAPPRLAADLRTVSTACRWGLSEDAAWAAVGPHWARVAGAVRLGGLAGVPIADVMRSGADEIRAAERHRVALGTAKLGVRLVAPLGLAFLPAFVLTTVVPVVIALTTDVLST